MLQILSWIGVVAMVLTPIVWGMYFYKFRNQFKNKRNM